MVQRRIRRQCRHMTPATVKAVARPVAPDLTRRRWSTGPYPQLDRAVARCVSPMRPDDECPVKSRQTGPQHGAITPRVARSGTPHGRRAVDAAVGPTMGPAEAAPPVQVTGLSPPESALDLEAAHQPPAAATRRPSGLAARYGRLY
ncbi:hypothetical protein E3N88_38433 [Mikania micrantha]|uniref:Uncharacterized protein n=1 Tax=Mikania micrantha TaxID=192012 RepID=A0A5N6LTZ3_9ASTR|nr:hypothetical protein E3N88_38433 [Mikania micrantha]